MRCLLLENIYQCQFAMRQPLLELEGACSMLREVALAAAADH